MEKQKWLMLSYNLPTEPSRYRVATWRGLKKLGAVNLQQAIWVLPHNEENLIALEKIAEDIETKSGEAFLLEAQCTNEKAKEKIIANFNAIREEEYTEFITECEKYLKELEKEISIEKFTFAELEEEEEELLKLISWYKKIAARDLFQAANGVSAREICEQIQVAFEKYSELVYSHEDLR
ncbi:MAG: Chromate resistance protein ChrB [Desulfitobacterium sp.]